MRSCYIRPIVNRGYGQMGLNPLEAPVDVTIACWEWGAYLGEEGKRDGVRAKVSSWRRISPDSLIPHAKACGQYLNSVLAKVESLKAGYEEAILLDDHGHVCEGTGENVYIVREGVIATPGQHNSILDGIVRRSIIQIARDLGYTVEERNVARAEMYLADEVFLTGTAAELVPVREIDDHKIGTGKPGEVTRRPGGRLRGGCPRAHRALPRVARRGQRRGARDADRRGAGAECADHDRGVGPMADIQLYDATLRDGMGGGGMTLTAAEKVRVVHALDALGVHMIEAGFPVSNPKEMELFELLAGEPLEVAEVVAFGMTRRRGVAAEDDEGLAVLASCFAPICTLVGKSWILHVEKVVHASREENLQMIGESIALLRSAGKRVLFDAEHFFDGFNADPGYALETLRAAAEAGRRAGRAVRHQRRLAAAPGRRSALAVVRGRRPRSHSGSTPTTTPAAAVANTLTAVEAGATQVQGTINGIGERTGNANLVTIIADLQLKMGVRRARGRASGEADRDRPLRRRAAEPAPEPAQPYVGRTPSRTRRGLHAAGVAADADTFEHIDPEVVGNEPRLLISELSGTGAIVEKAPQLRVSSCRRGVRPAGARAGQGARARGLPVRGRRRLVRAADAPRAGRRYESLFRLESWRVTVEKRADGNVETEATIRFWKDGRALRAARRGQRPGRTPSTGAARGDRRPLPARSPNIELVNFKVRILDELKGTGAVTRVLIDASDGHDVWGSIGVSRERHRGLLGRAPGLAGVRPLPSPRPGRPGDGRQLRRRGRSPRRRTAARPQLRAVNEPIPLARPVLGEPEEHAVVEVLRSGQLSLGPRLAAVRAAFADAARSPAARARSRAAPPVFTWPCGRSA